jgi:hypothetical protein
MKVFKNDAMKWTLGLLGAVLALFIVVEVRSEPTPPPSADALERRVILFGHNGALPDSAGWVAEATALMQAHPEMSARIGRLAESAQVDGVARGLILDALAKADNESAQEALRHALQTRTVEDDATYPLLLERLGRISLPTGETMAFLEETHDRAMATGDRQLGAATDSALSEAYAHRLAWLSVGHGTARLH